MNIASDELMDKLVLQKLIYKDNTLKKITKNYTELLKSIDSLSEEKIK